MGWFEWGVLIKDFDVRFEGDAFDQIQKFRVRHLGFRLVHQGQKGRFHYVRAETSALQPRRDCDKNVQIALLQFLDVLQCGRIRNDDLSRQVIGHVLADLHKIPRDDL